MAKTRPTWVLDHVVCWAEDVARPVDRERLTDAWRSMFGLPLPAASAADDTFEENGCLYLFFEGGYIYGCSVDGDFIAMTVDRALQRTQEEHRNLEAILGDANRRLAQNRKIGEGIKRVVELRKNRIAEARIRMRCVDCARDDMAPVGAEGVCASCGNGGIMYMPREDS